MNANAALIREIMNDCPFLTLGDLEGLTLNQLVSLQLRAQDAELDWLEEIAKGNDNASRNFKSLEEAVASYIFAEWEELTKIC